MSTPTSTYTAPSPPGPPAPAVNLSRHSLLHRLECYYSLVSPSTIANTAQWKNNFELIYTKYGGSVEGECKLANKLMKKYGSRVLLLTVTQAATEKKKSSTLRVGGEHSHHHSSSTASSTSTQKQCHDESYYEINSNQEQQQRRRNNSHIVDFTSPHFDPRYTLYTAQEEEVIRVNNYLMTTQPSSSSSSSQQQQRLLLRLDNISKFRSYLPTCDPLHIRNATTANKANAIRNRNTPLEITTTSSTINNTATITNNNNDDSQQQQHQQQKKKKKPSLFLSMVQQYETTSNGGGPLSLLYNIIANRQRANIKIRNKHTIRGIVTAYIFGFDKHFNLWCKDCCEEVYHHNIIAPSSSSITTSGNNDDNCIKQQRQQKQLIEKQRYFHQLFIRGDNIVMIWRA